MKSMLEVYITIYIGNIDWHGVGSHKDYIYGDIKFESRDNRLK